STGRLELFTGIRERRFWESGTMPSDAAACAGRMAIEKSGISQDDIGLLIHSSVSRDFLEPATASVVHEKIGLNENAMIFDLSNACLGFLNSMVIASNLIESGIIKSALIVAGENGRPLVESTINNLNSNKSLTRKSIKGSFASLTIGSGAAAAVLVHSSVSKHQHMILGGSCMVASNYNNLCQGGQGDESKKEDIGVHDNAEILMNTDAETLLMAGCALARKNWKKMKSVLKMNSEKFNRFFCHQVGSAYRKLLLDTLKIDPEKDYSTFSFLGNMGSVSLPATLSLGIEKELLKKDDIIALLGIGSGINSLMLGVKW
ncbi:3-oxoacyl-ACP synthase III, partial [bacterium]|nr:3-oxoacyl-ACP synthase III [bacterium]